MPTSPDSGPLSSRSVKTTERHDTRFGFKRHFILPGLLLGTAEVAFIALPVMTLLSSYFEEGQLLRIGLPVLAGAQLAWWVALGSWLSPIYRAIVVKRRGERLGDDLAHSAYRATFRLPLRALLLRTALWAAAALAVGLFQIKYANWNGRLVGQLTSLTALHAFCTNAVRAVWYDAIVRKLRRQLFSGVAPLRQIADGYFRDIIRVAVVVSGATLAALVAFLYYFLPINNDQYIQITALLPAAPLFSVLMLLVGARPWRRRLDTYLDSQLDQNDKSQPSEKAVVTTVYRVAQSMPYRMALVHVGAWLVAGAVAAYIARSRLRFEFDDAVLMLGVTLIFAIGAALYQALWHREKISPLLEHLTVRHRLPVRAIRASLSLRAKLLLSFGGMVLFSCGMALFWGFIQYKNLVTDFAAKQTDLGLAWLRSEVSSAAGNRNVRPDAELVREVLTKLGDTRQESGAVFYYLDGPDAELVKVGGGPIGAPVLPWYVRAQLELPGTAPLELQPHSLSGRRGSLDVYWRGQLYPLGSIAVFYPTYRGRGVAVAREIRELLLFFLVLFGACGGMVLFTVAQFVRPIRRLEQRAEGMARGDLAKPVTSGGEGDEIGRLTFALEEMRRALREKIRSTEEINLDLERAVQRRTADLAKKNRELAETLAKLTRAQDQLVQAEKMASIGQLVAGIAHEINNPVNAIVNTVGPLGEALDDYRDGDESEREEAATDLSDMLRVVQRGAERTKAIVQALHNYSRTDDEKLVDVDLNRSLDDSLELLRHLLKKSIAVERGYGDVGRIRGHAGQLNQVFMNLLTNAAQAVGGQDGATITVETEETKDGVEIRIGDNGAGISPELLPRIFDPFFTTKDVGEGSGLGLSIVHGIVDRHGGSIEVDSEPGVGTTFKVRLPRNRAAA